jgi:HD superfamily phosphohydrolase YqeK
MQVMGELAEIYALDLEKALSVGLLHDAGKDLLPDQQEQILKEAAIEIRFDCDRDYLHYLHGPVGAYFVCKELGLTDPLVLDAISMHTYYGNGENFDAPLVWCLRFSDIIEPTRDWSKVQWLREGASRLRKTVYSGRLAEGAFLQTGWLIKWFEEAGKPVHPNMRRIYQELSIKLNMDSTFLER